MPDAAFRKTRQKLSTPLFIELYKLFVRYFYHKIGGKPWHHFRLMAVDGSALNLPPSKELLDNFGHHHTNSVATKTPSARVGFMCGILNRVTVDAQKENFKLSGQEMFEEPLKCIGKCDLLTAGSNYEY